MRLHLTLLAALSLSAGAFAQSYSSFTPVNSITGVKVTPSNFDLTYDIKLESGAYFTIGAVNTPITQLFGFWHVGPKDSLNTASGVDQGGWTYKDSNNNNGQIAGWDNSAQSGRLNAGDSKTLTYTAIKPSFNYGFHFSYTDPTGAVKTGYFRGPLQAVPEPSSMAALALGGVALLRRRRR